MYHDVACECSLISNDLAVEQGDLGPPCSFLFFSLGMLGSQRSSRMRKLSASSIVFDHASHLKSRISRTIGGYQNALEGDSLACFQGFAVVTIE